MTERLTEFLAYVARRECGCLCGAVVNNPDHRRDVQTAIAGWVKQDLAIERMTCAAVRAADWSCPICSPDKEAAASHD